MKKLFITLFIAAIAIYLFGDGSENHQSDKGGSTKNVSQNNALSSAQQQEEDMQSKIEAICRKNIKDGDELVKVEVNEDMSNKNYGSGKLIVLPISEVTIFTQDMSGMTIMKSTLSAEKATAIDWKNVRYSSFDKQLDKFWTAPGLRN